jgi:two-component system response regulator HupR/HoxA
MVMARTVVDSAVLLIVDDEPLNRDLLRRVLFHDYEILEAEDAAAAAKLLESEAAIDVLVCDHIMPGASGTELARDVQNRWPHIVSILLTGYDDAPEVHVARRTGVIFEVLAKPWMAPQLRDTIARAVVERRKRSGAK